MSTVTRRASRASRKTSKSTPYSSPRVGITNPIERTADEHARDLELTKILSNATMEKLHQYVVVNGGDFETPMIFRESYYGEPLIVFMRSNSGSFRNSDLFNMLYDAKPELFENRVRHWREVKTTWKKDDEPNTIFMHAEHEWIDCAADFVDICFRMAEFNIVKKWFGSAVPIPLSVFVYRMWANMHPYYPAFASWVVKQIESNIIDGEEIQRLLCADASCNHSVSLASSVLRRMIENASTFYILEDTMWKFIHDMSDDNKNRILAGLTSNEIVKVDGLASEYMANQAATRRAAEFVRFLVKCGFTSAHIEFKVFLRAIYLESPSNGDLIRELGLYDEVVGVPGVNAIAIELDIKKFRTSLSA